MTAQPKSPLESAAVFAVFLAVAYRVTFSAATESFFVNATANGIVFVGVFFLLLGACRRGGRPLCVNLACAALFLFALAYFLAARAGHYPRAALEPVLTAATLACLFFAVSAGISKRSTVAWAACFVIGLSLMASASAAYQYWELPRLLEEVRGMKPPFSLGGVLINEKNYADFLTRIESRELFSNFLSSNVFAGFIALTMPVTLSLAAAALWGSAKRLPKLIFTLVFAAVAVFQTLLLLMTKSKGGLAAAGAGVIALVIFALFRLLSRRAFVAAAIAIGLLAAGGGGLVVAARSGQFTDEAKTSMAIRMGYWRATGAAIREAPLLGVGPGNFEKFYLQQKDVGEREVKDPHNSMLLTWVEGGLFSLIFLVAFWTLTLLGVRGEEQDEFFPPPGRILAAVALPAAALLRVFMLSRQGGLTADGDLYPALALLAGALAGGGLIFLSRNAAALFDAALVRAGLAAGVVGYFLSSLVDISMSDPGAATAAIFVAAAVAPRGKRATIKPGGKAAVACTALAAVGLVIFATRILAPFSQAEALTRSAHLSLMQGDLAAASATAAQAKELDPADAATSVLLGRVYEEAAKSQNEYRAAAIAAYKEAIELDRWNRPALEGLWRVLAKHHPVKRKEALDVTLRLLDAYPTSSRYQIMAASIYERLGITLDSLIHYRLALYIDDHVEQHGIKLSDDERARIRSAMRRVREKLATTPPEKP